MLDIDPQTVYFLIVKARQYDDKDEPGFSDDEDNLEAENRRQDLEESEDPVAQEIRDAVDAMNDDQQAELVALVWLGRGDYIKDEWAEAVQTARERHTGPTSDYLLGIPLLGDYLEEGMVQLGHTFEEFEVGRL